MADPEPFLFVSHVSEDRAAALEIVGELERRGVPCWIAPRNIEPGKPFDDEIAAALDRCRAMLLIFSEQCNESEYIRREVTVAGESHKVIIPFRIEDAQPRRGLRVRLSDLHWLDGFAAHEGAIEELTKRFAPAASADRSPPETPSPQPASPPAGHLLAGAPAAEPTAPPARRTVLSSAPAPALAKTNNRTLLAAVGMLAIACIVAAVWFWPSNVAVKPTPPPAPETASPLDLLNEGKAAFDRRDYAAAMRFNHQAADQGNATAQTYVGYLYEKGLGTAQDYAEALNWYRKAANQAHPPAQRNIGNLYEQGAGVPRDNAEAMRWFRLAADQGNAGAQTNVGHLFEQGLGVPQDYTEALRWYRKAADQGETTAQNNIGVFYDKGYGVTQDYGEALRWYRMAADQGNLDAQYNLALLYAEGHGVPRDLGQAREWMQKAATAGDPEAKKWVNDHGG